MKKLFICTILMLSVTALQAKDAIKLDHKGELLTPDMVHLNQGIRLVQKNQQQAAISRFIQASEYGNELARYQLGLLYLRQNNQIEALAWLNLIESTKVNNEQALPALINAVTSEIETENLNQVERRMLQLKAKHNPQMALANRKDWRAKIRFTGSRLRHAVNPAPKIYTSTNLMVNRSNYSLRYPTAPINSFKLRKDINDFVENYHYDS